MLLIETGCCRARSRQGHSASLACYRCNSRSRRHFSAHQKFRSKDRSGRLVPRRAPLCLLPAEVGLTQEALSGYSRTGLYRPTYK